MTATLRLDDREFRKLAQAYSDLGSGQFEAGMRRGINQAGNKGRTAGIRATAAHAGVPQKFVRAAMVTYPARGGRLEYRVRIRAKTMKLIELGGAKQGASGTSVKHWGHHRSAFLAVMASGHRGVFTNTRGYNSASGRNNAIKELWGPNLAKSFDEDGGPEFVEVAGGELVPALFKRMDSVVARVGRRRGVLR